MFFWVPVGAELCSPLMTPDSKTLFLAGQHLATDGVKDYPGFERSSTFAHPGDPLAGFQTAYAPPSWS
jgi:secreted PhoX family phosphatase